VVAVLGTEEQTQHNPIPGLGPEISEISGRSQPGNVHLKGPLPDAEDFDPLSGRASNGLGMLTRHVEGELHQGHELAFADPTLLQTVEGPGRNLGVTGCRCDVHNSSHTAIVMGQSRPATWRTMAWISGRKRKCSQAAAAGESTAISSRPSSRRAVLPAR